MLSMMKVLWTQSKATLTKFRSQRGATLAEYVLLVGFIAVMIIGIVIVFRNVMGSAIEDAGNELSRFR